MKTVLGKFLNYKLGTVAGELFDPSEILASEIKMSLTFLNLAKVNSCTFYCDSNEISKN